MFRMFWKKKNKLPVTLEDKDWVDEKIEWLKQELSERHFLNIRTVTPTKNYFERVFDKSEKDAEYILEKVSSLMCVKNLEIDLIFYSDNVVEMEDGSILTTPADENGQWSSSAGAYQMNEKGFNLYIEREQLKDSESLISTISHELAHEILLGENRIQENDEYLTDLTAIVYGFGIFLGNSKFKFSQFEFSWQSSSQGYLPEQIIAYAMAKLSVLRNEDVSYSNFLNSTLKKYFNQSYQWLTKNHNPIHE